MMKRVVILGSTGMLGHMVLKVLSGNQGISAVGTHIGVPTDPFYFNVESGLGGLEKIFNDVGWPDYVINCIGILKSAINERNSASVLRAIRINSVFPHQLAEVAVKRGFRVIQISTDGVFSGSKESYDEDTPCDCLDIYGKTKSLGEVNGCVNFINIRCSIIGRSPIEKMGLVEWLLGQPDGAIVTGFTNQIWNGISTIQFASLCKNIILRDSFDVLRCESAVFHFAPNEPISKYKLLCLIRDKFHRKIEIKPVESGPHELRWVLKTKFQGLKDLYPQGLPPEEIIAELYAYANK
ncbi:MAG: SDR family oxidoreductase [Pseudomonadota bacterium]